MKIVKICTRPFKHSDHTVSVRLWIQYIYPEALAIHFSFCAYRLRCVFREYWRNLAATFAKQDNHYTELYLSTGDSLIDSFSIIHLCKKFYLKLGTLYIHEVSNCMVTLAVHLVVQWGIL